MMSFSVSQAQELAIKQHYEAREMVIKRLVDMHTDDYDITDRAICEKVMERYGLLNDGFASEINYIIEQVSNIIRQKKRGA